MSIDILKKIKTKLLLRKEYIDILKNKGYKNIYVVKVNSLSSYSTYPLNVREYVNNKVIHNIYELLVDNDITIIIDEFKKWIHFNGTCDSIEVKIVELDGSNVVSPFNISNNYIESISKNGRRKTKN